MVSTNFRVLLVEESLELATPVLSALTQAGFAPRHVARAEQGMATFASQPFHLVLLSLGLPRIGGAALCAPLRQTSSVPIVILSVRTRKEDHLHALNLGADEFITMRPFDEQLTVARILTLMRRVYQYPQPPHPDVPDTLALQKPQAALPVGWATCDFCSYMGPQGRFDRLNAQGQRALMCPHCDQTQSVVFNVG